MNKGAFFVYIFVIGEACNIQRDILYFNRINFRKILDFWLLKKKTSGDSIIFDKIALDF